MTVITISAAFLIATICTPSGMCELCPNLWDETLLDHSGTSGKFPDVTIPFSRNIGSCLRNGTNIYYVNDRLYDRRPTVVPVLQTRAKAKMHSNPRRQQRSMLSKLI